jgi:hypothetical protein
LAKFYGKIGYGFATETAPGVWKDAITERTYSGDVIRNSRQLQESETVNDDLTVGNSVSIVADAYAFEHFHHIRYVIWSGAYWKVTNVDVQRPRLTLRFGGIYNGPKA